MCILAMLGTMAVGCRSSRIEPRQEYADTITQAGLIVDLARGDYEGFFPVTNLVRYGDHGLGTFHNLDGEMIIYSGVVYRAASDWSVAPADTNQTTPYAVATFFQADRMFDVENMDQKLFGRALDMRRRQDRMPHAIQVHGIFESMTIRSIPAQEQPWRSLDAVLKSDQRQMTLTNVAGVMIGYHYPDALSVLHPPDYHFHFIDQDITTGGHVLDFKIVQARISVDYSPGVRVFLSTNPPVNVPARRISPKPAPIPEPEITPE